MRGRLARAATMTALAGAVAAAGLVVADRGTAARSGAFLYNGEVTRVVDGDTLDVRLTTGKLERVRLIGIDTPERGACFFSQASSRARSLALNRKVTLRGDMTQDTRDRYGRLLAYVDVAGRADLGGTLIREGYGQVYVYSRPFARVSSYRTSQGSAKSGSLGLWKACLATPPVVPTPPPPAASACHASYSPCLPVVADLDCADIRAMGVAPVRVLGSDPYRLDADRDGLGCE